MPAMPLSTFTPLEKATHVPDAAAQGLLPRAWIWPLTLALTVAITGALWPAYGIAAVAIAALFARMAALDITTYTLPNVYTVPLVIVGFVHALSHNLVPQALVALLMLSFLTSPVRHSFARLGLKLGLGGGDIKLLAALFAFLPLPLACWSLALGCILWLPVAFAKPKAMIPFGIPILAGWIIMLCVPHLPNWLISTIS
ncbi:MAG: hypothetical protein DI585_03135 [Pseudomonas fluorescens]|nr:MAG: hypothetical protein DI585_03135 [Pseudomonas fluorescens]